MNAAVAEGFGIQAAFPTFNHAAACGNPASKRFFFEKKNQKTSAPRGQGAGADKAHAPDSKSFFASFCSQKEVLPFYLSPNALYCLPAPITKITALILRRRANFMLY